MKQTDQAIGIKERLSAARMRLRCAASAVLASAVVLAGCGSKPDASTSQHRFGMLVSKSIVSNPTENPTPPDAQVALAALKLSESSVVGGASATITVTLAHPAPVGGVKVLLHSSESVIVRMPASVEFGPGKSSLSFEASTFTVGAAQSITISAQNEVSIVGANLLLLPQATTPFMVSVLLPNLTVQQGKSRSAMVTTKANAGFNHSLTLKASSRSPDVSLTLKPRVIPAPGSGTSVLDIGVDPSVQTGSYPLTITASDGTASASAVTILKVISGTTNPDATFKGCWHHQNGHRYQAVDFVIGKAGSYPFNAILYNGASCNPNDWADEFGFGELIDFGAFGYVFWFSDFADQTNVSALWYVGDEHSQCVSYATAPNCEF